MQVPSKGYDLSTRPRNGTPKANGWLSAGGDEVKLWVFDVSTGFALEGETAQSARTRSYFPHNASQVSISVSSQFPSQKEYADVTEFVRSTHLDMGSKSLCKLEIVAGAPRNSRSHRNNKYGGVHQPLSALGYVQTIKRAHKRHEYAPTLQFEFVVQKWIYGWDGGDKTGWGDSAANIRRLKSWHDIVEGILRNSKGAAFEADPDADAYTPVPDRPATTPGPNGQQRPN